MHWNEQVAQSWQFACSAINRRKSLLFCAQNAVNGNEDITLLKFGKSELYWDFRTFLPCNSSAHRPFSKQYEHIEAYHYLCNLLIWESTVVQIGVFKLPEAFASNHPYCSCFSWWFPFSAMLKAEWVLQYVSCLRFCCVLLNRCEKRFLAASVRKIMTAFSDIACFTYWH